MRLKRYKEIKEASENEPLDSPALRAMKASEDAASLNDYLAKSNATVYGKTQPKAEKEDYKSEHDDIDEEEMEHLKSLLIQMFKNSGVEAQVENDGLDIEITCVLNRREKMKNITKILDIAKKLKRDILQQYDSEFEMWETTNKQPLMIFNFDYNEGLEDDNQPF